MLPSLVRSFKIRVFGIAWLLVLSCVAVHSIQRAILAETGRAVRALGRASPPWEGESGFEEPAQPIEPLGDPIVKDEDFEDSGATTPAKKKQQRMESIFVPRAVVDSWVRRGTIPEVTFVPRQGGVPGGLVTNLTPSFVPGLKADDRLTHVDGVPVRSVEGVVSLVARALREKRTSTFATFCRSDGVKSRCVRLAVELPRNDSGRALDPG